MEGESLGRWGLSDWSRTCKFRDWRISINILLLAYIILIFPIRHFPFCSLVPPSLGLVLCMRYSF